MWPFHQHRHVEQIGGLYADERGGPRTYHEIWWECACGDVIDKAAKARANAVDAYTAGGGFGLRRDQGPPRRKCKWHLNDMVDPFDMVVTCNATCAHHEELRDFDGFKRECAIYGKGDQKPMFCGCGEPAVLWITTYGFFGEKVKAYCHNHEQVPRSPAGNPMWG